MAGEAQKYRCLFGPWETVRGDNDMDSIRELVGKRVLLNVGRTSWSQGNVEEYKVLEVSPSSLWVKLQNLHGNKFWKRLDEISLVEELKQFEPNPEKK